MGDKLIIGCLNMLLMDNYVKTKNDRFQRLRFLNEGKVLQFNDFEEFEKLHYQKRPDNEKSRPKRGDRFSSLIRHLRHQETCVGEPKIGLNRASLQCFDFNELPTK
jgi:hypothetical protein